MPACINVNMSPSKDYICYSAYPCTMFSNKIAVSLGLADIQTIKTIHNRMKVMQTAGLNEHMSTFLFTSTGLKRRHPLPPPPLPPPSPFNRNSAKKKKKSFILSCFALCMPNNQGDKEEKEKGHYHGQFMCDLQIWHWQSEQAI